jgi:hypothetical protein
LLTNRFVRQQQRDGIMKRFPDIVNCFALKKAHRRAPDAYRIAGT